MSTARCGQWQMMRKYNIYSLIYPQNHP